MLKLELDITAWSPTKIHQTLRGTQTLRIKITYLEEATGKDRVVWPLKSKKLTGTMKRGCIFADKEHTFVEIYLKIGSALQEG